MLEVRQLKIGLGRPGLSPLLVDDLSFRIGKGEAVGIVGESGSGKTLTALSIMKLLPDGVHIREGNILFEQPGTLKTRDLVVLGERQMEEFRGTYISMVFQEPMSSLNPSMKIGEQILEASSLHPGGDTAPASDRIRGLLEEVKLPSDNSFIRKYPHQLSGGQRQRIMIAMALAGDPCLMIADEPTTALDVTVQKKILELLKEIRSRRQMSLLFISHDLGVIRSICDRALVMYQGRSVEEGSIRNLFNNPSQPYTKGLINCRPGMGSNPHRLKTVRDFLDGKDEFTRPGKEPAAEKSGSDTEMEGKKEILLEVRDVEISYKLKRNLLGRVTAYNKAVDRMSFEVFKGETLGLIGESGCGKSTLGRSIVRLLHSGKGDILYRGTGIASLKGNQLKRFRQRVQFIFQDPYSSLSPRIRVGEAIAEVLRVHRHDLNPAERKARVLELFSKVGLSEEHYNRYPHEFSGGQRQRIGIARALATEPELLICDESVSSLDVSVQAMILNLLNDLKEDFHLTYLFISHDLSVVRYMSDRILVMQNGKLVEQGTGEKIFSNPESDYTRNLIDAVPD